MPFQDFFSKIESAPKCKEHKYIISYSQENLETRIENIEKRFVLEKLTSEDRSFVSVQSYIKGSSTYAFQLHRRLSGVTLSQNDVSYLSTLTYPTRDDCIACAYKSITASWRNYRNNWNKSAYPKMNSFIGTIEPHKDGFPHLHVIQNLDRELTSKELGSTHKKWGARTDYQKARNPLGYIFKYLTKGLGNLQFISFLSELNCRQYFTSRNFLPKYSPTSDASWLYLGEQLHELIFDEYFYYTPLSGLQPPTDGVLIATRGDLWLYGLSEVKK